MHRLEIINKLKELEERKTLFINLNNDINSHYTDKCFINAKIETKLFDKKYNNESIKVNKVIFTNYINEEIKIIEDHINKLIKELTNNE